MLTKTQYINTAVTRLPLLNLSRAVAMILRALCPLYIVIMSRLLLAGRFCNDETCNQCYVIYENIMLNLKILKNNFKK